MENFLQKWFLKPIKLFWKNNKPFIIHRIKLFFLPITILFNIRRNELNKEWYFLINKNHHYGFIIEAILLKLKMMEKSWPDYKFNEREMETLRLLIKHAENLLDILEKEEASELGHLRSKEYLDKQKQFFNILHVKLPEMFH